MDRSSGEAHPDWEKNVSYFNSFFALLKPQITFDEEKFYSEPGWKLGKWYGIGQRSDGTFETQTHVVISWQEKYLNALDTFTFVVDFHQKESYFQKSLEQFFKKEEHEARNNQVRTIYRQ